MLVVTITEDDGIVIGRGPEMVRVHLVPSRGRKVRLGIEAPPDMEVDRQRVRARMDAGAGRQEAIEAESCNATRRLCTREGLA